MVGCCLFQKNRRRRNILRLFSYLTIKMRWNENTIYDDGVFFDVSAKTVKIEKGVIGKCDRYKHLRHLVFPERSFIHTIIPFYRHYDDCIL